MNSGASFRKLTFTSGIGTEYLGVPRKGGKKSPGDLGIKNQKCGDPRDSGQKGTEKRHTSRRCVAPG